MKYTESSFRDPFFERSLNIYLARRRVATSRITASASTAPRTRYWAGAVAVVDKKDLDTASLRKVIEDALR